MVDRFGLFKTPAITLTLKIQSRKVTSPALPRIAVAKPPSAKVIPVMVTLECGSC